MATHRASSGAPKPPPKPDDRVLSLLLLLMGDGRHTRHDIFTAIPAYATRISSAGERKFERDKKLLRSLGVSISEETDNHTYWIERRAYELPNMHLDAEETELLILAAQGLRTLRDSPQRELGEQAARKLAFDRVGQRPGMVPPHLAVNLAPRKPSPRLRRHLGQIGSAIEARKSVVIKYAAHTRKVDPYGLAYRMGDWLLVGYCRLREAMRTFRVDRIASVKATPRPGTPDFNVPADFDLGEYLRQSPWIFETGVTVKPQKIVLEIGPERAWVANEYFGEQAIFTQAPNTAGDAWIRVAFQSGNPDYVITRVLDGGGHLRLVSPRDLRRRIREQAEAIARHYDLEEPSRVGRRSEASQ